MRLGLNIAVMISGIHISTALKPSLKYDRKHVLRLLPLYLGKDQS